MKKAQFSLKSLFVITAMICVYMGIITFISQVYKYDPDRSDVWEVLGCLHFILIGVAIFWIFERNKSDDKLLMALLLILLAILVLALFL